MLAEPFFSLLAHGEITLNLWISHSNQMPVQFLRITFYLRILLLLLKSLLTGCTRRAPGSRFELKHILTCDLLDPLLLLMGYHFAVDNIFFFQLLNSPLVRMAAVMASMINRRFVFWLFHLILCECEPPINNTYVLYTGTANMTWFGGMFEVSNFSGCP